MDYPAQRIETEQLIFGGASRPKRGEGEERDQDGSTSGEIPSDICPIINISP